MIFYFTGTGNSYAVAKEMSKACSEELISIGNSYKKEEFTYELNNDETLGFIFPTYWYGIPTIVEEFLKKLEIKNYKNQYTYLIATYGIVGGNVKRYVQWVV